MAIGPAHSTGDPFSAMLDDAEKRVPPVSQGQRPTDGFLFSGNRHESVPRALFLDRRLTPLERNAWQVFRLLLNEDGVTAFPTYEQLRPYLASMPCAPKASYETVARALTLLRLTRWLSLARRRRDPRTGRLQGNLYLLHDEPLTPFEAMQIDADYLDLVSQALTHTSKAIQRVAQETLKEIDADPLLRGRALPTRLQMLAQRLNSRARHRDSYPQDEVTSDSEVDTNDLIRNRDTPTSESESGRKAPPDGTFPIPNKDRTVRNVCIKDFKIRTVPRARELRLPERFLTLKPEQRSGALVALRPLDPALQQTVLDEWAARCQAGGIRNPPGYLFGVIQKAIKGEFHAWAAKTPPAPTGIAPETLASLSAPERDWSPPSPDPQTAVAHLERLQHLFDDP